jgi:uncharacterized membrane protein
MQRLGNLTLYFLASGVALYALIAYGAFPLGALVHPAMQINFNAHHIGIYTHIFASSVALLLGPWQFSARLRQHHTQLHRWLGRTYLTLGVLVGGSAGLYMAQFAYGGGVARAGFTLLAWAWLLTGIMAYRAIRNKDIQHHRRWMLRNFALTLAAVTLRIYLPLSMVSGLPFDVSYPIIAWLCWVPNVVIIEWWLRTKHAAGLITNAPI